MNLFYTINDAFVPQLGAAICSVCENNRDCPEITFFIGALDVTEEHRRQLEELTERYGREIRFIPIDNLRERFGFGFDTLGWNEIVLARLLIDKLLPGETERVLYLDGDTIVTGSLRELWETDLGGRVLAASAEPTANRERKKQLGLEGQPYFNSGVLLIDLKKWREEDSGRQILAYYEKTGGKLFAPDQDAINGALRGQIALLSPKYNWCNIYWDYPYRTLKKIYRPAEYISEEAFRDAQRDPRIIHYLGEDRPWRRGNTHRYAGQFERYLAMTPWKDMPQETGWEIFLRLYGVFRTVLKPFPMARYRIIDGLIPAVMKARKRQRTRRARATGETGT